MIIYKSNFLRTKSNSKNKKLSKIKQKKSINRNTKNKGYKGGAMKLIGEGTHGRIYKISDMIVLKSFLNRSLNIDCICSRIKTNCKSLCDHIHYEYLIQQLLYNSLLNIPCKIKIPKVYNFELSDNNTKCNYEMDYIYPPKGIQNNNHLIQIDMCDDTRDEIVYGVGHFLSYTKLDLSQCTITSLEELAFEIGQLFSYLHYILRIDGYDCELVIGRLYYSKSANTSNDSNVMNDIFFIDFDKVSCFDFELGYIVFRKIDENTIETKELKTVKKFAWFLFNGITGMSLLPRNNKLKNKFLEGYAKYSPHSEIYNSLEYNVYKSVVELILEY